MKLFLTLVPPMFGASGGCGTATNRSNGTGTGTGTAGVADYAQAVERSGATDEANRKSPRTSCVFVLADGGSPT
jgi:hypothetical protein